MNGDVALNASSSSSSSQSVSPQSASGQNHNSLHSLSSHRLPAVPQIAVDGDCGDYPFSASLPSQISRYQIEEALYLDDQTPFGKTAIVTTSDITSFSSLDQQDVPLILQVVNPSDVNYLAAMS